MIHQVTSSDGVTFWVESYPRTVAYDRAYAARHTAAELDQKGGDFARSVIPAIGPLDLVTADELFAPAAVAAGPYDVAFAQAPRPPVVTRSEVRSTLRLIQGGKS